MKLRIWITLAHGVVLESIRRKDIWVVAILGFLILISAGAIGIFGFQGLQLFAKDLAVTVLGIFSTIIAILTSCRLLPEEIKNKTLYPLLARPISRFDLLFGKLLGAIFVTWVSFLVLSALTSVALLMFGVSFDLLMLQYAVAKMIGLALVCSVSLCISAYMTPSAAATMAFILTFGSSMLVRAISMAGETASPMTKNALQFLNALLPQFGLFDFGSRVANLNWAPVPAWVIGFLAVYMVAYSSAMLVVTWAKFKRQAL